MGRREAQLAWALMMIGGIAVLVAAIAVLILGLMNIGHLLD